MIADKPNLTHDEYFRLTGTLCEARSLELIDLSESIEEVDNARNYLSDAGFGMGEDAFTEIIDQVTALKKHVRGDNLAEIVSILEKLDTVQTEFHQATEHTKEQIGLAIKALEKLP